MTDPTKVRSTIMTIAPISAPVALMTQLEHIRGLVSSGLPIGSYHTFDPTAVVLAQIALVQADYRPVGCFKDGNDFYQTTFNGPSGEWPDTVTITFVPITGASPSMALMYRLEDGSFAHYTRAGRTTLSPTSTEGIRMVMALEAERPDAVYFWLLAFDGSPFLTLG